MLHLPDCHPVVHICGLATSVCVCHNSTSFSGVIYFLDIRLHIVIKFLSHQQGSFISLWHSVGLGMTSNLGALEGNSEMKAQWIIHTVSLCRSRFGMWTVRHGH